MNDHAKQPHQKQLFDDEPAPWELDAANDVCLATVVFASAPFGPLDYLVPEGLRQMAEAGRRMRVPLGRGNRTIVGYCVQVRNATSLPANLSRHRMKPIHSVVDERPLLSAPMMRLVEWMADYYVAPLGQVVEGVVPSGVRAQAGTRELQFYRVPNHVVAKLTQLKLPMKQAEVLRIVSASLNPLTIPEICQRVPCTAAPIRGLQEKGLLIAEAKRVMVHDGATPIANRMSELVLNEHQQRAFECVRDAVYAGRHETVLIFGVTGSGKTELYMRAIEEVIAFGRQAIVLVPEISLTPQTVSRFRARFDRVAVLHSHLTPQDRNWHWRQIARGDVQVIVGARSAVFAPTPHLGLIVLDEEHDASFKQDTIPRYHARDVAMHRAQMESIPVILGSATPALESWQRAIDGQYQLVRLPNRILDRPLPHVGVLDLRSDFTSRATRGPISRQLHQAMHQALADRGQIILLLNRRGFATSIQCPACGHVVKCPDCDLSLTHHREGERAICHYCDHDIAAPTLCPACRAEGIRYSGLGTQRLELEVKSRFPSARCLRMDSDTMQKPGSHEEAFARFRAGEIDILVGTQMISKGLDFPNVTLVGVINADTALHFPDFRSAERTFQLVTQVAGRTGRGERGGSVLVQTFSPEHPAIVHAAQHDFEAFANQELPIRREFGYPPFSSMVRIIIRGPSEKLTEQFADQMGLRLQEQIDQGALSVSMLGPAPAPMAKLRGNFRFHILLQGTDGASLRELARTAADGIQRPDDVLWLADVDPIDML